MTQLLELSDRELCKILITVLKVQVEKLSNMYEQLRNFVKEVEILRKDHMEMLEMKMNPFDALISRLNTTEKLLNLPLNLPKINQAMSQ